MNGVSDATRNTRREAGERTRSSRLVYPSERETVDMSVDRRGTSPWLANVQLCEARQRASVKETGYE